MIPTQVGTFSPEDARQIHQKVLGGGKGLNKFKHGDNNNLNDTRYGILDTPLVPASNPLNGYTTCYVVPLRYSDLADLDMEEVPGTANREKLVNRSTSLSAQPGTMVIYKRVQSEWAPIWVDCEPSTSSSIVPSDVTPPP